MGIYVLYSLWAYMYCIPYGHLCIVYIQLYWYDNKHFWIELNWNRQCSHTLNHQYTTTLPLTLATTSFLPCDKRTKWPPWTKRPITHQHRVNVTKVSSRLTDTACLPRGTSQNGHTPKRPQPERPHWVGSLPERPHYFGQNGHISWVATKTATLFWSKRPHSFLSKRPQGASPEKGADLASKTASLHLVKTATLSSIILC